MYDVYIHKTCFEHGIDLGSEISRGMFGVVYNATMKDTGEEVVVKIELIEDPEFVIGSKKLKKEESWKNEINFQKEANKHDLATKIINSWTCHPRDERIK